MILSSIYQIDAPTGNVSLSEVNSLKRNPFVKNVIPLSMGDNYNGFRIVGTTSKYPDHFGAKVISGSLFEKSMEVTLGRRAASILNLKVGNTFASSHGLDSEGDKHGEKKYKVVGIFDATGSVVDQLILTSLSSVWDIHEHSESRSKSDSDNVTDISHQDEKQVTSALIQFRNPMGLLTIPRQINENTSMQAALPSIEINRLFSMLGIGVETLQSLALIIIAIAAVSVFISLYNSLKERRYEMALMLSMGATRTRLFFMLLMEGLMLSIIGYMSGIVFSRIGLFAFSQAAEQDFHYSLRQFGLLPEEIYLFIGALLIGFLAAALPSLGVYSLNISRTLAEE